MLSLLIITTLAAPATYGSALQERVTDTCVLADSVARAEPAELQAFADALDSAGRRATRESRILGGLSSLRLGLAGRDRDALNTAFDELDRALKDDPRDACLLYHRGVARAELGARGFFALEVWARLRNRDNTELAIQDFQSASELRPEWIAPIRQMARLSIDAMEGRPGRRSRWQEWARASIQRHRSLGYSEPEADLWEGRLQMEADLFSAALVAFYRYESETRSPLAQLEQARALFALDRVQRASEAYWAAVDALPDDDLEAELRRDLWHIATPREEKAWADLEDDERASWIRNFWSKRAANDLVSESERLAEHYERLRFARKNYRLMSEASVRLSTDRLGRDLHGVLDDRGTVYIRMGEPDHRIGCLGGEFVYHTWIYEEGDQRNALHFSAERGVDDWRLLATLPARCYGRLGAYDSYYNFLAFKLEQNDPLNTLDYGTRERLRAETVAGIVLASDRHPLPLDGRMEFGYEWLFFRGHRPGTIDVTLSYAIAGKTLECEDLCAIEMRASIFGRDTVLARMEGTGETLLRPGGGDWVFGHLSGTARPGVWSYRVAAMEEPGVISDERMRGNRGEGAFVLPPLWSTFGATRVSVSSLVLARPGSGEWRGRGHRLALNPLHIYPPGATVDLYYEVYGVPVDASYATAILLYKDVDPPTTSLNPPGEWIRKLGRVKPALHLSFEESGERQGQQPWLERRKTLNLSGIKTGRYTLVLAITPPEGEPVYRVAPMRVSK